VEEANKFSLKQKDLNDLYLCFCGQANCQPNHSYGPAVKPCYVIHYITSGKGKFTVNGHTHELSAGQGFVIYPDTLTYYEADEKEPWSYIWVGFNGTKANQYLKAGGFSNDNLIYKTDKGSLLLNYVTDMLSLKGDITATAELRLLALLCLFLSTITKDTETTLTSTAPDIGEYVTKAITYIRNNYHYNIKVSDIAAECNLNRCYLSTIFSRTTGQSPQQYLTTFRITRAGELLRLTNLSVGDISRSCGYIDIFTFSKAFKKVKGVSPIEYRKAHAEEFVAGNAILENRLVMADKDKARAKAKAEAEAKAKAENGANNSDN